MTEDGESHDKRENYGIKGGATREGGLEEEGERGVPGAAHKRLPPGSAARQRRVDRGDNR